MLIVKSEFQLGFKILTLAENQIKNLDNQWAKGINPKRNMWGLRGPRKTLTGAVIVTIVIREPMFYLIKRA